jgi:virulence factor Mce-like protein
MNPDAKVKLLGVQVGRVDSIDYRADGTAVLHLALDPAQLRRIPANITVDVASTTAFGAKYVQLIPPPIPDSHSLQPGAVLDAQRVTVEINTVFEQLTSVLTAVDPAKLNATLSAISQALSGRGKKIGDAFVELDSLLARLEPSLPNLEHDLQIAPSVINTYADAATDLTSTLANTTRLSRTLTDQQQNLDALLISAAGLGEIGADVVGANRQPLTDVLHLLVPTTALLNQYHGGLYCALAGMIPIMDTPPPPVPGVLSGSSFTPGKERYRYPGNLPKVAAKGDPHCAEVGMPNLPFEGKPKFLVADVGANPWQYGNQKIMLNSDRLKEVLFGPLDGPPRNTAQIGQPG